MKIFVTGGSGFVGGHLIEALARDGHEVAALARSDRAAETVKGYGARPVRGDLGAVTAAQIGDAEAVIHAAARAEEWGTRAQFWEANVDGTTAVLAAAKEAGARRFIHVGTEAAIFAGQDLVHADETVPYPARHRYLYAETKAEAERRVLAASTPGFAALSIRPRFVWGPRDTSVLPAILDRARAGKFAWIDGGRALTSTTHVANVVHGLTLALTRGEGGRAYFVTDDGERTLREFLTALLDTQGVDLGTRVLPRAVARPLARVVEGAWRALRLTSTPPITCFAADMLSSTVTLDTSRARRELGYAPVITVEEGLRRMREISAGSSRS
ncbi:MAG: NAD-dependent epimerase/dehydratase family protein [Byssovorax sp.]